MAATLRAHRGRPAHRVTGRHALASTNLDVFLRDVRAFLESAWDGGWTEPEPDRVLATVLFTDLVGSTARAAELGDRAWRKLLEQHHARIRQQLVHFRGHEHDTAGDGFFASFDGPARAIRCACAIRDSLGELDLDVRAGLHTGECELLDNKVAGIAVAIGARVAAQASPGEVLVSGTVKDLVAGRGSSSPTRRRRAERGARRLASLRGRGRRASPKGLPSESRQIAQRSPGWITSAELDNPLEGPSQVGDREVRERDPISGAGAAGVDAELGRVRMRLQPRSFALVPGVELDAEQPAPEPLCAVEVVRRKLDDVDHASTLEPGELGADELRWRT